jgi:hypothetical protein
MLGVALAWSSLAAAQVQQVDPNAALQSDMAPVPANESTYGTNVPPSAPVAAPAAAPAPAPAPAPEPVAAAPGSAEVVANVPPAVAGSPAPAGTTYKQEDVLSAAEGVFGRGAEGLAKLIEKIFKDQGEPNGYIAGREAGGAIAVGVRYGSGTLTHKVEGQMPVYWTGPSLGLDLGANGSKTFVLVYNLWDTAEIFRRYPAVEGNAYVVGGFTASYLRRGSVVLIPIRLGVGWRLGVNAGYMKFTKNSKWFPF